VQIDLKSTGCAGESANHIKYLEHVQLFVSIEYPKRGDLHLNVTSPMGTDTMLLSERVGDYAVDGFKNWPFMSVHTWGENPSGVWQIRVNDRVRNIYFILFCIFSLESLKKGLGWVLFYQTIFTTVNVYSKKNYA
jgi:subtilisin-like proprotein convertase family protein